MSVKLTTNIILLHTVPYIVRPCLISGLISSGVYVLQVLPNSLGLPHGLFTFPSNIFLYKNKNKRFPYRAARVSASRPARPERSDSYHHQSVLTMSSDDGRLIIFFDIDNTLYSAKNQIGAYLYKTYAKVLSSIRIIAQAMGRKIHGNSTTAHLLLPDLK